MSAYSFENCNKNTAGLQRAVTVQRLAHNWLRLHVGLGKQKTPAMAIRLYYRPISVLELYHCTAFTSIPSQFKNIGTDCAQK